MMDWNIFWSAFGAIGTTLGSLITAIAVIVTIKQYNQPLRKMLQIDCMLDIYDSGLECCTIYIKNRGIRPAKISSIGIRIGKKRVWLIPSYHEFRYKLPITLEQEEVEEFGFGAERIEPMVKSVLTEKRRYRRKKLVFWVIDSFGDEYFCRTNIKVKNILKKCPQSKS